MSGYNKSVRAMIRYANKVFCTDKGEKCVFGSWSAPYKRKKYAVRFGRRLSDVVWVTKLKFRTCKKCGYREYDREYSTEYHRGGVVEIIKSLR